ncbi:MAG: cytochrome c [bacterium]
MNFRSMLVFLVIAGFVSMFSAPAVLGQKKDGDPNISYRQKVMKSQVVNLRGIFDIVKKKVPHKRNLALHAQIINNNAKMILAAFKQRAVEGPTDAKPAIWENWKDFEKKAKALQRESAKLVKAARSKKKGAFGAQLKKTGKACGSCHKKFRKPKEESYKRKKKM